MDGPIDVPTGGEGVEAGRGAGVSTDEKAYRSAGAWVRFIVPAAVGTAADLMLKSWAFPDGLKPDPLGGVGRHPGETVPVIDHVLGLTTTANKGMVFGLAQGHVGIFLMFSVVALAVIVGVFVGSGKKQWVVHVALGMITAGAIGNLYDRAMFHGVRDMLQFICLHFRPLHIFNSQFPGGPLSPDGTVDWYPYIFNLADVMLCVGVPLLMVRWMFAKDSAVEVK